MVSSAGLTHGDTSLTVSNLRKIQSPRLIPGTHEIRLDPEEGVDRRYAAQALAAQETSLGVFRYLPDRQRVLAESIYDSTAKTDKDKMERLRNLHEDRALNIKNASNGLN